MTVETPQPRDRVRWRRTSVIEGVVVETGADGIVVRDADGYKHLCQVDDATIEVLDRALCPATEGATGIRCQQPRGHEGGHKGTTTDEQTAVVGYPLFVSWPAEAPARREVRVPNEPHGPSADAVAYMARLIKAGKPVEAVGVAHDHGMEWADARRYVEAMPEYETYLNHHGGTRETCTRDECPAGPVCSSGATVWHDKTPDCEKRTEVDEVEADRMRAMGFDKQPEFKLSDEDRPLIRSVLLDRQGEYFDGNLYTEPLAGVVADIVWAAIRRDRERGDR